MVNASLNWASIVGIVLAVCGGGLYFLRSFKPALARDYDVFFAAALLIVVPAAAFLIFVSQKDSLERTSATRRR